MIQVQSFHPCLTVAGVDEPGAQEITDYLSDRLFTPVFPRKPSLEEFEKLITSNPHYKPTHGDSEGMPILCTLCKRGLYEYIPSVLKMGDKNLINHGDSRGLTPLFYAVIHSKKNIQTIIKLIEWGSDLFSLTTSPKQIIRFNENFIVHKIIPANTSILWVACELRSASDVMILYKSGALFNKVQGADYPMLTQRGKKTFEAVKDMIHEQGKSFSKRTFGMLQLHQNPRTYFYLLPSEVFDEVERCMARDYQLEDIRKAKNRLSD